MRKNLAADVMAALALCGVSVLAAPAMAQAPITFAGQGARAPQEVQTASIEPGLSGGDERSYGYGANTQQRSGAVIDLRRPRNARVEPRTVSEQPAAPMMQPVAAAQPAAEQGAPAWLERERVGPPYEANGRWYVPTPEPGYEQTGMASWYGPQFHGQATASGEVFDQEALTAAHPTLPIPSLVQVTNLANGREVIVRVNDRGPFVGDRLIDLSRRSAEVLGFEAQGQTRVHVRYLGPAPRHVNADGAAAPASPAPYAPPYAPSQQAAAPMPAEGPMQLTVSAEEDDFDNAPLPQQPVYTAAAPPEGDYFVQVGAFSDLNNAHRVRAAIESAGPVAVDTRQTASGELFRVRLGPYLGRGEAEAARQTLADLGYSEAILASR